MNIIGEIKKVCANIYLNINKNNDYFSSSEEIKEKIHTAVDLLSQPNKSYKIELIFILFWSILNFIRKDRNIRIDDKPNIRLLFNNTMIYDYKNNNCAYDKRDLFFANNKSFKEHYFSSNEYYFDILLYNNTSFNINKYYRSIFFEISIFLLQHKHDDAKYIVSKLNYLRNNLTLTHGDTTNKDTLNNVNLSDCLVMISFINYLINLIFKKHKFIFPIINEIKSAPLEVFGTVTKITQRLQGNTRHYGILLLYTKEFENFKTKTQEVKKGEIYIQISDNNDISKYNIGDNIQITFVTTTNLSRSKNINNNIFVFTKHKNDKPCNNNFVIVGEIIAKFSQTSSSGKKTYYCFLISYNTENRKGEMKIQLKPNEKDITQPPDEYNKFELNEIVQINFFIDTSKLEIINKYSNKKEIIYFNNIIANGSIKLVKSNCDYNYIAKELNILK